MSRATTEELTLKHIEVLEPSLKGTARSIVGKQNERTKAKRIRPPAHFKRTLFQESRRKSSTATETAQQVPVRCMIESDKDWNLMQSARLTWYELPSPGPSI